MAHLPSAASWCPRTWNGVIGSALIAPTTDDAALMILRRYCTCSAFRFSSRDVSTRPSIRRPDPLHPRAVAAVEPFPCQALEERVSDISGHDCYSWLLNSNERSRTGIKHHQGNLFLRGL